MILEPRLAGSFRADHARADRPHGRAGFAEELAIGWRAAARDDFAAAAAGWLAILCSAQRITNAGVEAGESTSQPQAASRQIRQAAPMHRRGLKDRFNQLPGMLISPRRDGLRIEVFQRRLAAQREFAEPCQCRGNLRAFEPDDDTAQPEFLHDRAEHF